jgi:hypothetical protein
MAELKELTDNDELKIESIEVTYSPKPRRDFKVKFFKQKLSPEAKSIPGTEMDIERIRAAGIFHIINYGLTNTNLALIVCPDMEPTFMEKEDKSFTIKEFCDILHGNWQCGDDVVILSGTVGQGKTIFALISPIKDADSQENE